jgi:hypothetical protein
MFYFVNVKLVSEIVTESVPAEWLEGFENISSFMNNHYFSAGGSYVVVNPEAVDELLDGPFRELDVDLDDEAILEEASDGFELVGHERLEDGEVEISYRLTPGIEVRVEATSEDEAKRLCLESLEELLDIMDAAADESIGTEKVVINFVVPDNAGDDEDEE